MSFYRRPMSEVVRPILDAGLRAERLVEPSPTDAFHENHPELASALERRPPEFVCLRATLADE